MKENDYVDFYRIDSLLTGDEKRLRNAVREFVEQECMPIIADHFDRGTFPMALIPRMAQLELFGSHVDTPGNTMRKNSIAMTMMKNGTTPFNMVSRGTLVTPATP